MVEINSKKHKAEIGGCWGAEGIHSLESSSAQYHIVLQQGKENHINTKRVEMCPFQGSFYELTCATF
jgi:hypothetical protein